MVRKTWLGALACGVVAAAASCSAVNAPAPPMGGDGSGAGSSTSSGGAQGGGAQGGGAQGGGAQGGNCEATNTLESCGECGKPCEPAHALGTSCAVGVCIYTSCEQGYADCDGDVPNGCESQSDSDPANCSACGVACGDTIANVQDPLCVGGSCDYDACASLFGDCDGQRDNGCERPTNTLSDCGDCDLPCAPDHADGVSCSTGSCGYTSCIAPWDDCDSNPANGCEADTLSDDANCGGCGQPCQGTAHCAGGNCVQGCFSTNDVLQVGTQKGQTTRCESVSGGGFTCNNPIVSYGSVTTGVPAQHSNNDLATWCQQLGCSGFSSVSYGNRNYTSPWGKLFWCSSYDETSPHWCDWQDGTWYNQSLDSHPAPDGQAIVSITCN